MVASPAAAAAAAAGNGDSAVVTLTDENFEHLTQASSGSTTGAWLIEIYAPWCGHCKQLAPVYEAAAADLREGGVAVAASVDGTTHRGIMRRFDIKGFPTLIFLRAGVWTPYRGPRTREAMVAFASGGWRDDGSIEWREVPAPKGVVAWAAEATAAWWSSLLADYRALLATKRSVLLVTFGAGLVVGILLTFSVVTALPGGDRRGGKRKRA
uniref:Thioredoxin domain-containing protein n=1 Tax=Bicosoecida sp. CB-2014 TaxID=1486930 RepID=A0A7S1G3R0_9STRA|mmetsp:Transcript_12660/g.44332  ORF Transcript_12660/g.44332 Transcript_12660/m.44332 type:complete len:211 (+) Transcript_12660:1-633(+)